VTLTKPQHKGRAFKEDLRKHINLSLKPLTNRETVMTSPFVEARTVTALWVTFEISKQPGGCSGGGHPSADWTGPLPMQEELDEH